MIPESDNPGTDAEARSAAISALFREHNRALVNFLLTRLRDEQEAKEAAQEAYVKLLQLDQPVASGILRWYLFKIARRIAIDRQRQRFTRSRLDRLEVFDELDTTNSIEGQVMASDELARLRSALAELPQKCRRAFELQRFQGLSAVEVAQQMGLTDRMIRHYVRRALVYCRFRLEGATPEVARKEAEL
jgi:RNA polymerase sigma-70 factor (ECF subfamily)